MIFSALYFRFVSVIHITRLRPHEIPNHPLNRRQTPLRQNSDLSKRFNVICPVQTSCEKYSASPVGQIRTISLAVSSPRRGALAIVTNVGTGCGGRGSVGVMRELQG